MSTEKTEQQSLDPVLPFDELTKNQLGNKDTIRSNSTRGDEVVKITLDKVIVRDGFNVRKDMGDIEGLALSILENGQTVAGRVDVLAEGKFLLTDGHRRFLALQWLADQGHSPLFKAIVNPTKITEEQRILQMFTTQDNKPLEPYEVAELIQRLINIGYTIATAATKLGKTKKYVANMLEFANESMYVKEETRKGNITVSAVTEIKKQIPVQSERNAAIRTAIEKQKQNPKRKQPVKASEVTGKKKPQVRDAQFYISTLRDVLKEHKNSAAILSAFKSLVQG